MEINVWSNISTSKILTLLKQLIYKYILNYICNLYIVYR